MMPANQNKKDRLLGRHCCLRIGHRKRDHIRQEGDDKRLAATKYKQQYAAAYAADERRPKWSDRMLKYLARD
jgi:hypothetical protein